LGGCRRRGATKLMKKKTDRGPARQGAWQCIMTDLLRMNYFLQSAASFCSSETVCLSLAWSLLY
jgi:hypothetical protein